MLKFGSEHEHGLSSEFISEMEVQSEDNLTMCVLPERFRCEKYRVLSSLVDCVV